MIKKNKLINKKTVKFILQPVLCVFLTAAGATPELREVRQTHKGIHSYGPLIVVK